MTENLTFVHLTDLHVGNPAVKDDHLYSDTSTTLTTILNEVKSLVPAPKFVIASGDLTNMGDVASYEELKRIFAAAALEMPVLFALGNHDKREGFYAAMHGRTENNTAPYDHAEVIGGIHVITLDSSHPFRIGGSFEQSQWAWLQDQLDDEPDMPKLLVMHHAPALDADKAMEWESLTIEDTATLADMVQDYDVLGILSGHIHFDRVSNWYGIPVVVGIGQHAATDVTWLHEGLRMVSGASFALGTVRESGLTMSFVPQPAERKELHSFTFANMAETLKKYEAASAAAAAANSMAAE